MRAGRPLAPAQPDRAHGGDDTRKTAARQHACRHSLSETSASAKVAISSRMATDASMIAILFRGGLG
jgi:hypothetical protein